MPETTPASGAPDQAPATRAAFLVLGAYTSLHRTREQLGQAVSLYDAAGMDDLADEVSAVATELLAVIDRIGTL